MYKLIVLDFQTGRAYIKTYAARPEVNEELFEKFCSERQITSTECQWMLTKGEILID
jgi:hypothetical protein